MTLADVQVHESERLRAELARIAQQLAQIAGELERLATAGPEHGR